MICWLDNRILNNSIGEEYGDTPTSKLCSRCCLFSSQLGHTRRTARSPAADALPGATQFYYAYTQTRAEGCHPARFALKACDVSSESILGGFAGHRSTHRTIHTNMRRDPCGSPTFRCPKTRVKCEYMTRIRPPVLTDASAILITCGHKLFSWLPKTWPTWAFRSKKFPILCLLVLNLRLHHTTALVAGT